MLHCLHALDYVTWNAFTLGHFCSAQLFLSHNQLKVYLQLGFHTTLNIGLDPASPFTKPQLIPLLTTHMVLGCMILSIPLLVAKGHTLISFYQWKSWLDSTKSAVFS